MNYQFWKDALAGKNPAITEADPQPGFYRMRDGKGGPWLPVAIFEHDGELVARVANSKKDPLNIWTWCAGNPVAQADAKHAFEHGSWPGDVPDVPSIGDNIGELSVQEEIADCIEQIDAWITSIGGKITEDVQMDMAANWRDKLAGLRQKAEAQHKLEKAPHLEAGRAVDAAWKPCIADAKDKADDIRTKLLTPYMRAKQAEEDRRRREEERKAREEAEKRAAEARAAGEPESEPEDLPPAPAPKRVQAGGQRGRKTALRSRKVAVVTDYDKALAHFATHEKVVTLIEQLAQHAARDGHDVPGVQVKTEQVAA